MSKDISVAKTLVKKKLITEKQLLEAAKKKKTSGKSMIKILLDDNVVDESLLLTLYANELQIPLVDLKYYPLNAKVIETLPESLARRFRAIPIGMAKGNYLVAMSDPEDLIAQDEISRKLKSEILPLLVSEVDLVGTIDNIFRKTQEISSLVGEVGEDLSEEEDFEDELSYDNSAPIIQLLNSVFEDAVHSGASDIHIEPSKEDFKIRLRIDGVLQEQVMKDKSVLSAMVSRVKLMAKLNISERRLPQDGSFQINTKKGKYTIRLSTLPVRFGESVVMRILEQDSGLTHLDSIQMPNYVRKALKENIHQPNGVILITGPTGSGKSTLLYAMLNEVNNPGTKILTAEDPVEYAIEGLNQVQVQPKIELTFSRVLRSLLRQDPDVIMVGEVRDLETAEIALQASLTGHLVFSTVHTNDSVSTPERLIDLGVEPYLISSSLRMVVAQRLVRKICDVCRTEYIPSKEELLWLSNNFKDKTMPEKFYKGEGCTNCNKTGYKGRLAVFELLELDDDRLELIRDSKMDDFKKVVNDDPKFVSLAASALEYVRDKKTSIQEVFKLVGGIEF